MVEERRQKRKRLFRGICVPVRKRWHRYLTVQLRVHSCVSSCPSPETFVFFALSVLQRSGTYVSLCKLSSWSPLWESLAVKLILLSHTPVSVPHLSAQPQGPSCSFSTPGFAFFFSPTWKIHSLAASIETELDKFKRRGRESMDGQEGDRMGKDRHRLWVGGGGEWGLLVQSYLPVLSVHLETKRELPLTFLLCTISHVIS